MSGYFRVAAKFVAVGLFFACASISCAALFAPNYTEALRYKIGLIDDSPQGLETARIILGRMDAVAPQRADLFIGDSLTAALPTALVSDRGLNYGIGGQTSGEMLTSIRHFQSLKTARAVFIMIGTNDLLRSRESSYADNLARILSLIPADVPIFLSSPPPSQLFASRKSAQMSSETQRACAARPKCSFIDLHGALMRGADIRDDLLLPDRIHLNPSGVVKWAGLLTRAYKVSIPRRRG